MKLSKLDWLTRAVMSKLQWCSVGWKDYRRLSFRMVINGKFQNKSIGN